MASTVKGFVQLLAVEHRIHKTMPEGDCAWCKTTHRFETLRIFNIFMRSEAPGMRSNSSKADCPRREPNLIRTIMQSIAWACAARLGLSLSISPYVRLLNCPFTALCFLICPALNPTNRQKTSYHASRRDNYIRNFFFFLFPPPLYFSLEKQRGPFIQFAAESPRLCKLLNHPCSFFLAILQAVNFHIQFKLHN